jgi:uncharacterized membrane protein YdjX (TVP38/TMEM64 family)
MILIALVIFYYSNTSFRDLVILFSKEDKMKELILKYNGYSSLVFFLLQMLQVIISPIPGNVTTVIGGSLFGALNGFLLSYSAIICGSMIAYYLAKIYGKPLVIKMAGEGSYNKYSRFFNRKLLVGLFLLFLFPFFPDDLLCFLAGLSAIPLPLFAVLLIGRVPGTLFGALVGSGLIELSITWWVIIIVISLPVAFFVLRYNNQLEDWILRKIGITQNELEEDSE